jgi:phosphatidylserine/phosphatidylglycerophosphate/cardiolipin synthase-like enzyme
MLSSACTLVPGENPPTKIETLSAGTGPGWYSVYFTQPEAPSAEKLRGGPDAALAEAIRGARLGVDIAMDTLDLWSIRDALIDADQRGVRVRVVVESDNLDEPEIQDLVQAGIARTAREEKLMARQKTKASGVPEAAYHARMAELYRQHVLKEKPAASVIRIEGLTRAKPPADAAPEKAEENVPQLV